MKNTLKKVGKWSYYIVIAIVVLIMINNLISRSDKLFDIVGFRSYTVESGSMKPGIIPGDVALVKSVDTNDLEVNDVITFKYEGFTVTHRIVEKEETGFITKGDNNNVEDREIVPKEDVIGEVIAVIPKLGHAIVFLSKPIVIFLSLIMLGLLVLKETFFGDEEVDNKDNIKEVNKK